jgi:hypothetical protein
VPSYPLEPPRNRSPLSEDLFLPRRRPLAAAAVHGLLECCLLAPLREAIELGGPVDGVLLSLHGSFWADGDDSQWP